MAAGSAPGTSGTGGSAEHHRRVKVKAPKSGSERLELVLDTSSPPAAGADPHLFPWDDRDDVNCTPQNFYDAGVAHEGQVDYYDDPHQLRCPSSHSASTTETDNRTGSDGSGNAGLCRTWSMASDENGNLRYCMDGEEGEEGEAGDDVVYHSPKNGEGGVSGLEQQQNWQQEEARDVQPSAAGLIADDVAYSDLAQQNSDVSVDPVVDPQGHAKKKMYSKSVSFELDSLEGDADPIATARSDGSSDDDAIIGEARPRPTGLRKAHSEDTSVESVGWKVTKSYSRENSNASSRPASSSASEENDAENQPPPTKAPRNDPPSMAQETVSIKTEPPSVAPAKRGSRPPSPPQAVVGKIKGVLRKPRYSRRGRKTGSLDGMSEGSSSAVGSAVGSAVSSPATLSTSGHRGAGGDEAVSEAPQRKAPQRKAVVPAPTKAARSPRSAAMTAEDSGCSVATETASGHAPPTKDVLQPKKVASGNVPKRAAPPAAAATPAMAKGHARRKPPARSVSTLTRHPSYLLEDEEPAPPKVPPSPSISTLTRHPSYTEESEAPSAASDPSSDVSYDPLVDDRQADEEYEPQEPELPPQQQRPQPAPAAQQRSPPQETTFHHRRTLPRDHPSNNIDHHRHHHHHRPSLQRTPSNVSARSDVAMDGYVPPTQKPKKSKAERAVKLLRRASKKASKKASKGAKRLFKKKAEVTPGDGHEYTANDYGYSYDEMGAMPPPGRANSPAASPLAQNATSYSFEGYDHLRSPRGPSPPQSQPPTPRAAEVAAAAERADGRRTSSGDVAGHNPWAGTAATEGNPWAAMSPRGGPGAPDAAGILSSMGGQTIPYPNQHPNPFTEGNGGMQSPMAMPSPHGEYDSHATGVPAVKWWTWEQPGDRPDAGGGAGPREEGQDCTYFAFMCMLPQAAR